MRTAFKFLGAGLILWFSLGGCGGLKYQALKGTSLPNPPTTPVKIYISQFPVSSRASVLEPRAAVGGVDIQPSGSSISGLAEAGGAIMEISRPSRIEDLSGAILRELRQDTVRVFTDVAQISNLDLTRQVSNPFELVSFGDSEAQLEISGRAVIRSQRVSRRFSPETTEVEIEAQVKDLTSGRTVDLQKVRFGIQMPFNSRELEETMALAVVTYLTRRTLF